MEKDKKLDLYLDIIQDTINITCIFLLWVHVNKFVAIIVALFEFIRLGTYIKLGQKAAASVQKTYNEVLLGK